MRTERTAQALSPQSSALSPALRVALVSPFGLQPKGTTSARALPIARVLAGQGARVRLVVPPWDDAARAGQSWRQDGVEVVHTRVGRPPLGPAVTLMDLARRVREFRPDVVHAFKPIGYSGAIAWGLGVRGWGPGARGRAVGAMDPDRAASPQPLPPLLVVDTDDLEGPGGWASRKGLGIAGWLRGLQERHTLRTAPWVTVASQWLQHYVSGLGVPEDRILYLPNGHSVESQVPSPKSEVPLQADLGPWTLDLGLLWYTRFTEATPKRTLALLGPLLRRRPTLRLAVVGEEIDHGHRAALEAVFAQAGVAGQVDWLGYGPGLLEDCVSVCQGRIVAVYPMDDDTVNRARCPAKIPQLMAMGVPIVAEAVGEAAAYLAGFERECLATPGDAEGFRQGVELLLCNPEARAAVSARLQRAAESWRWERTAGGLLRWYQRARRAQEGKQEGKNEE